MLVAGLVMSVQGALAASLPPVGTRVDGQVAVVDGDTLRMGALRLRLHGIDAPEIAQDCTDGSGRLWACGAWAGAELTRLIAGRQVTCTAVDHDRYGRLVARCMVAGRDLGAALVGVGAARAYRAYSDAYLAPEAEARAARRGIWAGDHLDPADWRAAQRGAAPSAAPKGCAIKGNISEAGRIYHRPGQRDYDRTQISPGRGERWFCSEAEARAAGWRAARN